MRFLCMSSVDIEIESDPSKQRQKNLMKCIVFEDVAPIIQTLQPVCQKKKDFEGIYQLVQIWQGRLLRPFLIQALAFSIKLLPSAIPSTIFEI